jgi:hypothetical protein
MKMFDEFGHKHKWQYMFSAGDGNEFNWFFCEICMAQSVAKLDSNNGLVELQVFESKKPDKKKKK